MSLYDCKRSFITNTAALPDIIRLKPKYKSSKQKVLTPPLKNDVFIFYDGTGKEKTPILPGRFVTIFTISTRSKSKQSTIYVL